MSNSSNSLVVVGCSATKLAIEGSLPAVHLYDGPVYRILRAHLRGQRWSKNLSLAVLSAKHGLIGAMSPISHYDERMTPSRAESLRESATATFHEYARGKSNVHLILGKDYMRALDYPSDQVSTADGPIGMKLQYFSNLLKDLEPTPRILRAPKNDMRPLYFLPDWDDFLDTGFNFIDDSFSAEKKAERVQQHSIEMMRPKRLCDGVLVSLAQQLSGSKGMLRKLPATDPGHLRPQSVRDHFGLMNDQWAFGDCGAFSYVNEPEPVISVEQAVSLYDLHDFDLGASVDHIPIPAIVDSEGRRRELTKTEMARRVKLTQENAVAFLDEWRRRNSRFLPVGIIQGLSARSYAKQILEYIEMGYSHIALGGLVPKSDSEIQEVMLAVQKETRLLRHRPWLHLLGVYRPKLQECFRDSGVSSFDSATYFRKAWLRSDQNYLGADGNWYAAIRVPPSSDPRTMKRLGDSGTTKRTIYRLEREALKALREYASKDITIDKCLKAVLRYDELLNRGKFAPTTLEAQYRRTLAARPWEKCQCNFCQNIGIDVAIFRGYNRNKRRGAHNTLHLFEQINMSSGKVSLSANHDQTEPAN